MKKYLRNVWGRLLSTIVCAVAVSIFLLSIICGVLYAELGDYKTVYETGEQSIVQNYGLYTLDRVLRGSNDGLIQYLEKNNLYCAITKISNDSGTSEPLFTNADGNMEWDYEFEVLAGTEYRYRVDSFWGALTESYYYKPYSDWVKLEVTGHVYDAESGLFYYKTEAGYFLIKKIWIYYLDGTYMDFVYKFQDGKAYYYNGYYDQVLKKSESFYWTHMETENNRFILWDPDTVDDWEYVKHISTTQEIQSDIKNVEYMVEDNGSYIECKYDGGLDTYKVQLSRTGDVSNGMFETWDQMIRNVYFFEDYIVIMMFVSFFFFCAGIVLLFYTAVDQREQLGIFHKVPLGIYSCGIAVIEGMLLWILIEPLVELFYNAGIQVEIGCFLVAVVVFMMIWLAFVYLQNMISRIRAKSLIRYSEIHYGIRMLKWVWEKVFGTITRPFRFMLRIIRENVSLFWKAVTIFMGITLLEFIILVINAYHFERLLVWFMLGKIIEGLLIFLVLVQMYRLQEGAKRIASGDLSVPIDTGKMFWEFKKHGDYINNVGESIHLAVQEQMKSERFKTELITNVSHDIKTPLTSIINYVDLIKKEEIADETMNEYVEVLDRQSARLKKLIDDLMEASKASTGNLTVQLEEFDADVLLTQVIGEFEDRLAKNELQMVVEKPEHSVYVLADGRHMWRVLDNILNNACKYALPNTRVYVSLKQENHTAVIVFKNISKAALNIPSEELMERFVRGDSSRNTEGSGLGLSIAQSLTELMNGTMKLDIDGDLFKVTLRFPIVNSRDVTE